jgi:hypothetical protein
MAAVNTPFGMDIACVDKGGPEEFEDEGDDRMLLYPFLRTLHDMQFVDAASLTGSEVCAVSPACELLSVTLVEANG